MGCPDALPPPEQDLGAPLSGVLEVAVHLRGGGSVVERSHGGGLVEGVAEPHHVRSLERRLDELVVDLLEHDHPLGGATHLPGVVVGAVHRRLGGGGDIGVSGDDERAVARHLHDRALQTHLGDDAATRLPTTR